MTKDEIYEIAKRHHKSPRLVAAIAKVESNFNPMAVSSKGAIGLMQVMPSTAKYMGFNGITREALFDPETNIQVGSEILRQYQKKHRTLRNALDKYSGGAGKYYGKVIREINKKIRKQENDL